MSSESLKPHVVLGFFITAKNLYLKSARSLNWAFQTDFKTHLAQNHSVPEI